MILLTQGIAVIFWTWYWYSCKRSKQGIANTLLPWRYFQFAFLILASEAFMLFNFSFRPVGDAYSKIVDSANRHFPGGAVYCFLSITIGGFGISHLIGVYGKDRSSQGS